MSKGCHEKIQKVLKVFHITWNKASTNLSWDALWGLAPATSQFKCYTTKIPPWAIWRTVISNNGNQSIFPGCSSKEIATSRKKRLLCNRPTLSETLPTELESITLMRAGSYVLHPFAEQSQWEPTTAYLPSRRKEQKCLLWKIQNLVTWVGPERKIYTTCNPFNLC